jgi:hypothetical protein
MTQTARIAPVSQSLTVIWQAALEETTFPERVAAVDALRIAIRPLRKRAYDAAGSSVLHSLPQGHRRSARAKSYIGRLTARSAAAAGAENTRAGLSGTSGASGARRRELRIYNATERPTLVRSMTTDVRNLRTFELAKNSRCVRASKASMLGVRQIRMKSASPVT